MLSVVELLLLDWCVGCCLRILLAWVSDYAFVAVASVAVAGPDMMERLAATDVQTLTTVAIPRMVHQTTHHCPCHVEFLVEPWYLSQPPY